MVVESLLQVWGWLLSLPKEQLIIIGGGLALLVAVSKIMRLVFLLGVLGVSLAVAVPEIVKHYQAGSLPQAAEKIVENVGNQEETTLEVQVPVNLGQQP
jgi:hypothetical protein